MIHCIVAPLHRRRSLALAFAAVALVSCVTTPSTDQRASIPPLPETTLPATFTLVSWDALPGLATDRLTETWPALRVGCRSLLASARTAPTWRRPCEAAESIDGRDETAVRTFLATHFSPYAVAFPDGRREGLITGYYEPKLQGSRRRTARFTVPLYAVPDDLLTIDLGETIPELANRRVRARLEGHRVVPYWSRREIERGVASLANKAIAYVADPLDAFFLQIQGSGRVELPDGSVMRLGYADQNGHAYRAVANVLIARGEMTLETASMQSIRDWARGNADRLNALLDENPSYVFFREIPSPPAGTLDASIDGPLGSLGVPLLARRTIAVDARAIPLGTPMWLATSQPSSGAPIERLVLAQDTGGAIRGAVRADFFWGAGDEAAAEAGRMRESGRLWMLWPTGTALPAAP